MRISDCGFEKTMTSPFNPKSEIRIPKSEME